MKAILILTAILTGCAAPHIHNTGRYVITERQGTATKFKGMKGTYSIISDTLKAGDTITINVIRVRH